MAPGQRLEMQNASPPPNEFRSSSIIRVHEALDGAQDEARRIFVSDIFEGLLDDLFGKDTMRLCVVFAVLFDDGKVSDLPKPMAGYDREG